MKWSIGIAAAVLSAALIPAFGSSYDDYMRGMEAAKAGKADEAIAALTAALNAGDLGSTYVPLAHNDTTGVKELLQKVVDTCPQTPQQNWSRQELERVK